MMPREQRAYVIAMCAIIGGAFAYAACEWGRWPRLSYYPLQGDVTFDARGAGRSCPFAVRVVGALEAVERGARSADGHSQRAHCKRQGGARRLHPPRWPG